MNRPHLADRHGNTVEQVTTRLPDATYYVVRGPEGTLLHGTYGQRYATDEADLARCGVDVSSLRLVLP